MGRRYSDRVVAIYNLSQPPITFVRGPFYNPHLKKTLLGERMITKRTVKLKVAVTTDRAQDYDSIVHEFKHFIVVRLGLTIWITKMLDLWVDLYPSSWREESLIYEAPLAIQAKTGTK
jgi:hypothetical protein